MTFSLIGRDPRSGEIGIAVASKFFAVGAVVPYVRGDCAVAVQSWVNPYWALQGVRRLKDHGSAAEILQDFSARDAKASIRQVHMLDTAGRFAAFTGPDCPAWSGHLIGPDASAAGNLLVGEQVLHAMLDTFAAHPDTPLAERLLTSLDAGDAAGGDKRGRQSAALVVHRGKEYPMLDIRADDSDAPLAELRRLLAISKESYMGFYETLPAAEDAIDQ